MKRKVVEYLPFMGVVLMVCTASWLVSRSFSARPAAFGNDGGGPVRGRV
ncbi:hypothetical protein [Nonomuraea longispora]|nr:hypothetical protein [Nonomuraea longispora]